MRNARSAPTRRSAEFCIYLRSSVVAIDPHPPERKSEYRIQKYETRDRRLSCGTGFQPVVHRITARLAVPQDRHRAGRPAFRHFLFRPGSCGIYIEGSCVRHGRPRTSMRRNVFVRNGFRAIGVPENRGRKTVFTKRPEIAAGRWPPTGCGARSGKIPQVSPSAPAGKLDGVFFVKKIGLRWPLPRPLLRGGKGAAALTVFRLASDENTPCSHAPMHPCSRAPMPPLSHAPAPTRYSISNWGPSGSSRGSSGRCGGPPIFSM